ncbi:MAG: glycosyltransferase [bacterium]
MNSHQSILIIGTVWPEPSSSAAGSRMLQLISVFKNANYAVTFAAASPENEFTRELQELGCHTRQIELNSTSFDAFLDALKPAVVIFDRFMTEEQFGWRVMQSCPEAIRILDTEDLHGLRKARQIALKQNTDNHQEFFNDITKRELASVLRCDLTLIISEAEMALLKSIGISEALLQYCPFMLEATDEIQVKTIEGSNHFVTIGNFKHAPNEDAVNYLKTTIWPLIRKKQPNAELHIYGAYAQQKHLQLTNEKDGFIVKGKAIDALATIENYRVLLAPLRFGAGLKGKLIDAMISGTPMIMSSIAAEGMFGSQTDRFHISDEPEEFASQAAQLYTNKEQWNQQQQLGLQILKNRFDFKQHEEALVNKLTQLHANLETLRMQNTFGQLLQHQSLLAHRYLSKWIEEKNKS